MQLRQGLVRLCSNNTCSWAQCLLCEDTFLERPSQPRPGMRHSSCTSAAEEVGPPRLLQVVKQAPAASRYDQAQAHRRTACLVQQERCRRWQPVLRRGRPNPRFRGGDWGSVTHTAQGGGC